MSSINSDSTLIPDAPSYPPRMIHDENGNLAGVILATRDYQIFLKLLALHADWEELPPYWQDAIDNMLADEAEVEGGEAQPLTELLAKSGELP